MLMYAKYFHAISPFADAPVMNLLVAFVVTAICVDAVTLILFPKR